MRAEKEFQVEREYNKDRWNAIAHQKWENFSNKDDIDMDIRPSAILYDQYLADCLKHLMDRSTFQCLSLTEACAASITTRDIIENCLQTHKHELDKMDARYITTHMNANAKKQMCNFTSPTKFTRDVNDPLTQYTHASGALMSLATPLG